MHGDQRRIMCNEYVLSIKSFERTRKDDGKLYYSESMIEVRYIVKQTMRRNLVLSHLL